MSISAGELNNPLAVAVDASGDKLVVDMSDGRSIAVPLASYPRLANGTLAERQQYELIGSGRGIHWPDLDEAWTH